MTWGEFQIERTFYIKAWEEMKKSFSGPVRSFLDQSRIVVSCGREFEIDADFSVAIAACPAFFFNSAEMTGAINAFEISNGWCIEIKFPYVDIDYIQEVKASPYCDRGRTRMRPVSTAVVLSKGLNI